MNTLAAIFSALFGLAFGSFLNVCISRLPRGESVAAPRSRCPHCGVAIPASDNIPLISWLLLRGRCRVCRAPISFRYFLVEGATAALFLLCYFAFGLSLQAAAAAVLCFLLIGLAAMDAETLLLPDVFTLPGIVLGIVWSGVSAGSFWTRRFSAWLSPFWVGHPRVSAAVFAALTAGIAAGLILLIRWVYWLIRHEEGMGLGDAKLLAMIGAWFGPAQTVLVFFLAVIAGALYGITLIVIRKRARQAPAGEQASPTRVPLGTFLCLAGLYTLFWGRQTLEWYFSLLT